MKKRYHAKFSNGVTATINSVRLYKTAGSYIHRYKAETFNGIYFSSTEKVTPRSGLTRLKKNMPKESKAILEKAYKDLEDNYVWETVLVSELNN